MSATTGASKENNKNLSNTNGGNRQKTNKRFMGGNISLQGKTFEISSRDAVYQYTDTLKAFADYVGQEYKHIGDICYMIENMADYNFIRPQDPSNNATQFEIESWKRKICFGREEGYTWTTRPSCLVLYGVNPLEQQKTRSKHT